MGLFDFLDPTREWPVVDGPAPELNSFLQLDALPFGAPLESARFLGRPGKFESGRNRKEKVLLYAAKGLRLRFTEGKLSEVAYLIDQGAQPRAPDGTRLTSETDREQIVKLFGEPDPGGSDDTCLQVFHGHGVISDFYLDDRGHFTEWALYPDD